MAYEISKEDVAERLASFGFMVTDVDSFALSFAMDKATHTIYNTCNIAEIPDELREVAIDMAAGEFLYAKKQFGLLDIDGLDQDAVKSISEGDTTVTFSESDNFSARFDAMISRMLNPPGLVRFRRFTW